MEKLLIPLALDENNQITRPEVASKDKNYFCPSCGDNLILRKGDIKKPHFAHKASETCTQETVIHKLAKKLIIDSITKWKNGEANPPAIARKCQRCNTITDQPVPDKVKYAKEEVRLPNGLIADVVLFTTDGPVAALEVKVTHAVSEEKAEAMPLPFIEVNGSSIMLKPSDWWPVIDKFRPLKCKFCADRLKKYLTELSKISQRTHIPLPNIYYRSGATACWKCGQSILVFDWPENDTHDTKKPSGSDMPRTIQYRYSKTIKGKYWANTCPYCNALQGDHFLHREPEGPFFGYYRGGNTEKSFLEDMTQLALNYFSEY